METSISYAVNSPNFRRPEIRPTGIIVRFAELPGSIQEVAAYYNSVAKQAPHILVTKGIAIELLPLHPAKKTVASANICGYGKVRQCSPTKIGVFIVKDRYSVPEWRETLIECLTRLCQVYDIDPENVVTQGELYHSGMASRHLELDELMTQIRWPPKMLRANVIVALNAAAKRAKEETE